MVAASSRIAAQNESAGQDKTLLGLASVQWAQVCFDSKASYEFSASPCLTGRLSPWSSILSPSIGTTRWNHEVAERERLPTIFRTQEPLAEGGLLSYGVSFPDPDGQVGLCSVCILRGESRATCPFRSGKFEMASNLKTARALGVPVPPSRRANANGVIEPG
jgi:hypothetical protein